MPPFVLLLLCWLLLSLSPFVVRGRAVLAATLCTHALLAVLFYCTTGPALRSVDMNKTAPGSTKSAGGRPDLDRASCEGYVARPTMFKPECKACFNKKRKLSVKEAS